MHPSIVDGVSNASLTLCSVRLLSSGQENIPQCLRSRNQDGTPCATVFGRKKFQCVSSSSAIGCVPSHGANVTHSAVYQTANGATSHASHLQEIIILESTCWLRKERAQLPRSFPASAGKRSKEVTEPKKTNILCTSQDCSMGNKFVGKRLTRTVFCLSPGQLLRLPSCSRVAPLLLGRLKR